MIPVVYGGGNYSAFAPPHSVINVEDFEDVESLANYLKMPKNDTSKYLSYFSWKRNYVIDTSA